MLPPCIFRCTWSSIITLGKGTDLQCDVCTAIVQVANAADFPPRASMTAVAIPKGVLVFGGGSMDMDLYSDCWLLQLGPAGSAGSGCVRAGPLLALLTLL
jgi:hypothetical protein